MLEVLPFAEVWAADFEFRVGDGENPDPVCLVARELRSGRTIRVWQDELRRMSRPPRPMTRNWYSITARAGEAEVYLYDEIGAHGITAKDFIAKLKPHASKPIRLRVHSPGGSVFDAVAIYNALRNHPRKVTASVEGIAASAASVVCMAAAEIRAAGNSFVMIHDPHGLCLGGADAMRKMADLLDKVKAPLVAAYRRSGKSDAAIEQLMNDETWYSAEEAKKNGFVDHVDQPIEIAASFDLSRFGYRHPPRPDVGAAWGRVISAKFRAE